MSSSIHINDSVHMNKINPYTDPADFTPGVALGGAYKNIYDPTKIPKTPLVNSVKPVGDALGGVISPQDDEVSQGCEKTMAAGWRTPFYCTPGSQDYPLDRPSVPERVYSLPPWESSPKQSPTATETSSQTTKWMNTARVTMVVAILLMIVFLTFFYNR
jgi:hypothetical protein